MTTAALQYFLSQLKQTRLLKQCGARCVCVCVCVCVCGSRGEGEMYSVPLLFVRARTKTKTSLMLLKICQYFLPSKTEYLKIIIIMHIILHKMNTL